jgi:hypothetical protein
MLREVHDQKLKHVKVVRMRGSADPRIFPLEMIQGKQADCFPSVWGDLSLSPGSLAEGKDGAMRKLTQASEYL